MTLLAHLRTSGRAEVSLADRRTQFAIFSFLLAGAILFHQAQLAAWEVFSPHTVVSLSAIFVLLRPSSVARFLAMLAIHLLSMLIDMPYVVNHWLLLGLTTVGLGIPLAVAALRRRPWLRDPGELYRRMAPVVRIQVVLVYLFAVLAKLNTDFLNPALSCAAQMSQGLLEDMPLSLYASWQDVPAIWVTLLIEAFLPIGLLIRRTRVATIVVGGTFHTALGVAGHIPFSGFAFAFYALFLPDDMPRRLRGLMETSPRLRSAALGVARLARSPAAFPVLAGGWVAALAVLSYLPGTVFFFLLYTAALGVVLFLCLRQAKLAAYQPGAFRLAHPLWGIAPVLVVLNAVTPYLGLKTQNTFTMYSNLQTEEGYWNHAIFPEEMRIFDLQDAPIRIVSSDDERLARAARDGTRLVEYDLLHHLSENPDTDVVYSQGGQMVRVSGTAQKPAVNSPSVIERKLFLFRDIPAEQRNTCRSRRDAFAGPQNGS